MEKKSRSLGNKPDVNIDIFVNFVDKVCETIKKEVYNNV